MDIKAVSYAGFWRRAVALIIDRIIIGVAFALFAALMGVSLQNAGNSGGVFAGVSFLFLAIFGEAIYYAFFESSDYQATPGKMVLSLKVVDMEGQQISFWRSFGRNMGKYISGLILFIGYMMAGWTQKKQALHDMFVDCLVIRSVD